MAKKNRKEAPSVKVGSRVTYAKILETQNVEPFRRNATGTVLELDTINETACAKVEWDWGPGMGHWVFVRRLELVPQPQQGA